MVNSPELSLIPHRLLFKRRSCSWQSLTNLRSKSCVKTKEVINREIDKEKKRNTLFLLKIKVHLVVVDSGLLLVPLDPREQLGDVVLAPLLSVLQSLGYLLKMTMIVTMLMTKKMAIVKAMTTRTIWISSGRDNYDDYKDASDKGRIPLPNWMKFWKNSKRPLTPPLIFGKIML